MINEVVKLVNKLRIAMIIVHKVISYLNSGSLVVPDLNVCTSYRLKKMLHNIY